MTTNVLITGGRAPVALELARMLRQAGCSVYAAESLPIHLCKHSSSITDSTLVSSPRKHPERYIAELIELLQRWRIDWLLPTCEESFYISRALSELTPYCAVWCSNWQEMQLLHSKASFADLLTKGDFSDLIEDGKIGAPRTLLLTSSEQWLAAPDGLRLSHRQVVYKPVYSRFASRVIMPAAEPSPPPKAELLSERHPWVAQQLIEGEQLCTSSLAFKGRLLAHAAYASQYRNSQNGAAVYFAARANEAAEAFVRRLVALTSYTGHIGIDFIEDTSGRLYPIECNPRATSGIHLFRDQPILYAGLLMQPVQPSQAEQPEQANRLWLSQSGQTTGNEHNYTATLPPPLSPTGVKNAMLTVPMLQNGIRQLWADGSARKRWRQAFSHAEDAVYRREDKRPAFTQIGVLWQAWRISKRLGIPLADTFTDDIEWNGE